MTKGVDGRWQTTSPKGEWYMRSFHFHTPTEGAVVRGIWLSEGRDDELVMPVLAKTLNEAFSLVRGVLWSEPKLASGSTVTVLLDGDTEYLIACFTSRHPNPYDYGPFPWPPTDPPKAAP